MKQDDFQGYTDEQLLELLKKGNHTAFKTIFSRYWSKLYFYAHNVLDNKELCEDLIQEIFTSLWIKREQSNIQHLNAYLYQSVKFQIAKQLRSGQLHQIHIDRLNLIQFVNNTEDALNVNEVKTQIENSLAELPPKCREIFYLSRFEDLSHQEIAEKLSISIQTVKNQVSRALQHLRKSLNLSQKALICILLIYSIL